MKRKSHVRRMTELSVLMGIILLMAYTPLGYLSTPWGLNITLIVIPVAVGAVVLGPKAGVFLGTVFGLTSFVKGFSGAGLSPILLDASPVRFLILCVLPRMLTGLLPGMLYRLFRSFPRVHTAGQALCCFLTPVCNTVCYMTGLWLLFADTWLGYTGNSGSGLSLLAMMLSGVAVNGIVEAAACLLIGTAVTKALIHTLHRGE